MTQVASMCTSDFNHFTIIFKLSRFVLFLVRFQQLSHPKKTTSIQEKKSRVQLHHVAQIRTRISNVAQGAADDPLSWCSSEFTCSLYLLFLVLLLPFSFLLLFSFKQES